MSATKYDLIIVGGGLVGGSLACALGRAGLRVALVEALATAARIRGRRAARLSVSRSCEGGPPGCCRYRCVGPE